MKFSEYVDSRLPVDEIYHLQELLMRHGASLRAFIKHGLKEGHADHDLAFRRALQEFYSMLKNKPQADEYPVHSTDNRGTINQPLADTGLLGPKY